MADRPNILVIHTDQQRYDTLSCNGGALVETPNVDLLAASGVVFDRAYTCTGICAPERASLLTGRIPMRHGILVNPESGLAGGMDYRERYATYPELLRSVGYDLYHCGKWHVGRGLSPADFGIEGPDFPGYGDPLGSDDYKGYLESRGLSKPDVHDPSDLRYPDGKFRGPHLAGILDGPVEATVPHYLTEMALAFMARAKEPWCVRLDFWGPHLPYFLPGDWAGLVDPADIPEWPNFADDGSGKPRVHRLHNEYWGVEEYGWEEHSRLVAMYHCLAAMIDWEIGRILSALDTQGARNSTAVIFTTDHGGMVGSHRLVDKGPFMYEETYHTPLVVRFPGVWREGVRSDEFVQQVDLVPTILELAGVGAPEGIDGRSLGPILRGGRGWEPRDFVFAEFHGHQVPFEQRMVRDRRYKYIFNAPDVDELYDLETDPYEMVNRMADDTLADARRSLKEALYEWMKRVGDPIDRYFERSRMSRA